MTEQKIARIDADREKALTHEHELAKVERDLRKSEAETTELREKIEALEALLQWQSSDHATEKLRDIKALNAGRAQIRRCHAIIQGLVSSIAPEDCDALLIDAKKELSGEFCADACTTECDALAEADRKKIEELEATLSETERALECGRAAEGALLDRAEKAQALNAEMLEALKRARQLAARAVDWDLGLDGEIEMDDETWISCRDLMAEFAFIIDKAEKATNG